MYTAKISNFLIKSLMIINIRVKIHTTNVPKVESYFEDSIIFNFAWNPSEIETKEIIKRLRHTTHF